VYRKHRSRAEGPIFAALSSTEILAMFFGKLAPRLKSMVLEIAQLNAVLMQALPNDRFPDAVFFGDLRHTH
jgi:hypothetical protein